MSGSRQDIRPNYYKTCGDIGRRILSHWLSEAQLGTECRLVIRELGDNYPLGSAFNYLWRLGKKEEPLDDEFSIGPYKDFRKARFYLRDYLEAGYTTYREQVEHALANIEKEMGE
ncbi:MAG: hypothetical protein AAFX78_03435 [Cyanobacteria bacterium J06638_20]